MWIWNFELMLPNYSTFMKISTKIKWLASAMTSLLITGLSSGNSDLGILQLTLEVRESFRDSILESFYMTLRRWPKTNYSIFTLKTIWTRRGENLLKKKNKFELLPIKFLFSLLAEKYFYQSHLGDQCFFTLLGFEHPEWFYSLPCEYNYQVGLKTEWTNPKRIYIATIFPFKLDLSMYQEGIEDIFYLYHNCQSEVKIYHGNGGTVIPEDD